MRRVFVVEALRTPIGRYGGGLAGIRPDDLASLVIEALVDRTGVPGERIDDVILGAANQAGEDNRNVGRMAALLAGLPVTVPGQTVNRLCASGLEAIVAGARAIQCGAADLVIAGGVESMSRAPYVQLKADRAFPRGAPEVADTVLGWRFVNERFPEDWTIGLGQTAEVVAERYRVDRAAQDHFAWTSHQRAARARQEGRFDREIVPVEVPQRRGEPVRVSQDEHIRPDTTLEKLARLRPLFKKGGTVTAGNASGLNDGAAALLLASEQACAEGGWRPLAEYLGAAAAGVSPDEMGIGPVPATRRLLARLGVTLEAIELVELNEAFAAQSVACLRELGLDPERVNVQGGAIALGHPLGCSGARIVVTLLHEMRRRRASLGLATLCVGVGQGLSALFDASTA